MDKTQLIAMLERAYLTLAELRERDAALASAIESSLLRPVPQHILTQLGLDNLTQLAARLRLPAGTKPDESSLRYATYQALSALILDDPLLAKDASLRDALGVFEASLGNPDSGLVEELLLLERPLRDNPALRQQLDAAKLYKLGQIARIDDKVIDHVIVAAGQLSAVTQAALSALVQNRRLSPEDARALGHAVTRYHLLDERFELVATSLERASKLTELINLNEDDWVDLIQRSETPTPGDLSAQNYAALLQRKLGRVFPGATLGKRVETLDVQLKDALGAFDRLDQLRKRNPGAALVTRRTLAGLNLVGLNDDERSLLRLDLARTVAIADQLPGMRLAEVFDDPKLSEQDRQRELGRRVKMVREMFALNEGLLAINLDPDSPQLKTFRYSELASEQDRTMLRASARAYQRVYALTQDVLEIEPLLKAGASSALEVAALPLDTLVQRSGLSPERAAQLHARAERITVNVAAQSGAVVDLMSGPLQGGMADNLSPALLRSLKQLPGFEDLFGSQSFCRCEHCQSALGPGAYFIDLMSFVEDHISTPTFGDAIDHPLHLQQRRPDLWTIQLTCANADEALPHLVIVNEILERAVAREAGFGGDLGDRAALEAFVYGEVLPQQADSFQQPLHLAVETTRLIAKAAGVSLAQLGEDALVTGDALARLRLGLSPRAHALITQPDADLANLARLYSVPLTQQGASLAQLDAQLLLEPMGISRDTLSDLIATRFVTRAGTKPITIRAGRRAQESIQDDIEYIAGLTLDALDRMHRFVRLWRATGWRVGELDLVLTHLSQAGLSDALDEAVVAAVAQTHRLMERAQVSVEELLALTSHLPRTLRDRRFNPPALVAAQGAYPKPQVRFLHPALASASARADQQELARLRAGLGVSEEALLQLIIGLAPRLGVDPSASDETARAMALSEAHLSALYQHARLAKHLNLSIPALLTLLALSPAPDSGPLSGWYTLDALLTRRDWMQRAGWDIDALRQLARATHTPAQRDAARAEALIAAQVIVTQAQSDGALTFADTTFALLPPSEATLTSLAPITALRGAQISYEVTRHGHAEAPETLRLGDDDDLDQLILDWNSQARATIAYRANASGAPQRTGDHLGVRVRDADGSQTTLRVTGDSANLFTTSTPLLARGAEISEAQSRAIITANMSRLEQVDASGIYRLGAGFDLAQPLTLPDEVSPTMLPQVMARLRAHHSEAILSVGLAQALELPAPLIAPLATLLGRTLNATDVFSELRGDAPPKTIAALIDALGPLCALLWRDLASAEAMVTLLREAAPELGLSSLDALTIDDIQRIDQARALLPPRPEVSDARAFARLLNNLATTPQPNATTLPQLAALLSAQESLIQSIQAHLPLDTAPLTALRQLSRALTLAKRLGVGGHTLALARDADRVSLTTLSDALLGALRARAQDDPAQAHALATIEDASLSIKRDGLVASLLRSSAAPLKNAAQLTHTYLIDVELGGCARTSRLLAAIGSVQRYVQRCLMNLEATEPDAPQPKAVSPERIPAHEWAWRQHYRVWEANRKIFLYPENYLEPGLRDDKTPLFKALEQALLAKELSDEAITDAYAQYLSGFDTLNKLTIAGSYHELDADKQRDVLHLIGVTAEDPPQCYYRRVEDARYGAARADRGTRWGAWEKIEAQLPSRFLSPIIYQGQLHVFWVRYVTQRSDEPSTEHSRPGYRHQAFIEYIKRKLDGSWTPPQNLKLNEAPFSAAASPPTYQRGGIILDPIVRKTVRPRTATLFGFDQSHDFRPLYNQDDIGAPTEEYTLRGPIWERIYPTIRHVSSSQTQLHLAGINTQLWAEVDLYHSALKPNHTMRRYPLNSSPFSLGHDPPYLDARDLDTTNNSAFIWWLQDLIHSKTNHYPLATLWTTPSAERRLLHRTFRLTLPRLDLYTYTSLMLNRARIEHYQTSLIPSASGSISDMWSSPQWSTAFTNKLIALFQGPQLATLPAQSDLEIVNGAYGDAIIQIDADTYYLQSEVGPGADDYQLRRLNTSLSETIASTLATGGLDHLLDLNTQLALSERSSGITLVDDAILDKSAAGGVDYRGPMGVYLREIYAHIPALIADHLSSQGQYERAQRWYHRLFDPTAAERVQPRATLSEAEQLRLKRDRSWRYRELRDQSEDTLRAQLTDGEALEAYRRDPFNPHAIARVRLGAQQRGIVMRYVDNLIAWGDDLFMRATSQQSAELLREASLKYSVAQEILGARPATLGDCADAPTQGKTYPEIKARLSSASDFLVELETRTGPPLIDVVLGQESIYVPISFATINLTMTQTYRDAPGEAKAQRSTAKSDVPIVELAERADWSVADLWVRGESAASSEITQAQPSTQQAVEASWIGPWAGSITKTLHAAFCIPQNTRMLEAWDRVEDRLYKLRHCLDINGVARQLPLLAPPIDPAQLVSARAAGLNPSDMLAAGTGALPPYRFGYLLERAKAYAASAQGFGAALLSALERRDAEALARLRHVHQKDLLALTTEVRDQELQLARQSITLVERRLEAAQYRHDYYESLIDEGLSTPEKQQEVTRIAAVAIRAIQPALSAAAAVSYLLPNVGFTSYGGKQTGDSISAITNLKDNVAHLLESYSTIAGIVAGYERREQGWEHQRVLAEQDLKAIEVELQSARRRETIAARGVTLHERTMAQHDEVMTFFNERAANLDLYSHLARVMQQLHREVYHNALAMARLAEQAYHFERPDDARRYVGGEWDAARSGLLAGERLGVTLQTMERRFLETHTREAEINQSFSLAQLDPYALIKLKETGSCDLSLPELWFDLYYPGQYRRRLRTVRLTIPCITGPYTNVSARLTLLNSYIRRDAALGAANLFEVPLTGTTSVATSTAQGDAGVFELSFREERYMPFEGAGAVSDWRLELPSHLRPFDYQSINDVILNLSYTAQEDGVLRRQVEVHNENLESSLTKLSDEGALTRVFSLRQEFSSTFNRLIHTPAQTPITLELHARHFPMFLQGRALKVSTARLVVIPTDRAQTLGALSLKLNDTIVSDFRDVSLDPSAPLAGLPARHIEAALREGIKRTHTLQLLDPGELASSDDGPGALDPDKLHDLLLVIDYQLA